MTVFRYELRQLRWYTLWWSTACAIFIFAMLPTYVSMLSAGAVDLAALGDSGIFKLLGVDPAVIGSPIGVFGFLTAFFSLAAGVSGMFLGLRTFTKETVGRSAEFLYTKPLRRGSIFCAKVAAGLLASIVIGTAYILGALASALMNLKDVDIRVFLLVACSFLLIELFFLFFGALLGALTPKIRTPLLLSAGAVFLFYVVSAFASKVNAAAIKYLTPFSYFGASKIIHAEGYDGGYLTAYLALTLIFAVAGYAAFVKKDATLLS